MKRNFLVLLVIVLISTFAIGISVQDSTAAEKGKYGGIFKFNQGKGASRFGVPLNIRHVDRFYGGLFIQPLVRFTENQNEYIPELATSWELSPDRKHYTFHLRKGVKFHDGTDFNAQAVKWNLDKVPPDPRPVLDNVSSIDVIDDYTIRFNLTSWDSLFLNTLLWDACIIISPTSYEKNGEKWANTHPIGTGPWKLKSHKRNIIMKVEKFQDYWEKGIPYFDGMEITMIPDAMTAMAAFKRRDIDCLYQIDVISASELKASGKYDIGFVPWGRGMIVLNSTDPKSVWSNKKMRQALEYAIDKEKLCASLGRGYVDPIYEIIHSVPGNPGTVPRIYNPEKARQLIRDAGYPQGVKLSLTHASGGSNDFVVALQHNLADVGIQVKLNPVHPAILNQMSHEPLPGSDLRLEGQRGGLNNSLASCKETLSSKSVYFPGLKRPAGFDNFLQQALTLDDPNKIVPILEKMEKLAYDNVMLVPLWTGPFIYIAHPDVKNIQFFVGGSPTQGGLLHYTWFDKK